MTGWLTVSSASSGRIGSTKAISRTTSVRTASRRCSRAVAQPATYASLPQGPSVAAPSHDDALSAIVSPGITGEWFFFCNCGGTNPGSGRAGGAEGVDRLFQDGQRPLDHRVRSGEREPEMSRALERFSRKRVDPSLGKPIAELCCVRDGSPRKQIEPGLRRGERITHAPHLRDHPISSTLDRRDVA